MDTGAREENAPNQNHGASLLIPSAAESFRTAAERGINVLAVIMQGYRVALSPLFIRMAGKKWRLKGNGVPEGVEATQAISTSSLRVRTNSGTPRGLMNFRPRPHRIDTSPPLARVTSQEATDV